MCVKCLYGHRAVQKIMIKEVKETLGAQLKMVSLLEGSLAHGTLESGVIASTVSCALPLS